MVSEFAGFASLAPAYPEMLLAVGALVLLLAGVFAKKEIATGITGIAIGLLIAIAVLISFVPSEGVIFSG